MEVDYRCYQYNIAVPPFDEDHPISKNLIPYWKNFWNTLLGKINSTEELNENELHWQNRITYITKYDVIVGIHFIANHKVSGFSQSNYAQRYLPKNIEKFLHSIDDGFINTLQYLSVDPAYSQRKTGISFASVMSDISTLHHQELKAEQTLSVIRRSVGMHNMASKVGFKELCNIRKHGEDSIIMYNTRPKRHPKKSITLLSDHLWENRKFINHEDL